MVEYDVVCITESWLDTSNRDFVAEYSLRGYKIYNDDREGRNGGGVILYVSEKLNVVQLNINNTVAEFNAVGVEIKTDNFTFNLILAYRPPRLTHDKDREIFHALNNVISSNTVLIGDFNYPNVNFEEMTGDGEGSRLIDFMENNYFTQYVLEPTRENNILDLILSNNDQIIENVEIEDGLNDSDHNSITFNLKIQSSIQSNNSVIPDFSRANFDLLRAEILEISHNIMESQDNVLEIFDYFKANFHSIENNCIPRKIKRSNINCAPKWFNREIKNLLIDRNRAFKLKKRDPSENNMRNYYSLRRQVKRAIRSAKRNLEIDIAANSKTNPKRFYSYVNSRKPLRENIGPIKDPNGNLTNDAGSIATILNNFFSSVFTEENLDDIPELNDIREFTEATVLENITVFEDEIKRYIEKMKISKSPGPDAFHPRHLKELKDVISGPLAKIFNKSLNEGIVPMEFREANVTPIFKKGDRSLAGNYRPISLTSILGKILESVIRDRIVEHLENLDLIRDSQHGFRRKRSCLTNLLAFYDRVVEHTDNFKAADVIYLDFKKAFDKVPHMRLINKLKAYGIRGEVLNWIKEWLSDRRQRVVVNGASSQWVGVRSGVPQGSVLGPLLFAIYIDDIDEGIQSLISKFADDTKMGARALTEADRERLQRDLDTLVNWANRWQMEFNVEKCKVLHLGSNNQRFQYTMSGIPLETTEEEKDLGVYVDSDLKFKKQCSEACKKANKALGYISRHFCYKSKDIILPLYKAIVRPHLEYAVQFWSPFLREEVAKMERIQRRATKLIPNLRNKSYEERLDHLGLFSLETRRLRGRLIETFKILNKFDDVDYRNYFTLDDDAITRNNGVKLRGRRFRTNVAKNFFTYGVVNYWNGLPSEVVSSTSVNMFKNRIDKHFKSRGIR